MGIESNWQRLARRWQAQRADDRGEGQRRRALIMLACAGLLALAALFLARGLPHTRGASAQHSVQLVVAAMPIGFGETLTPDRLKLIDWPAQSLPRGSFTRIDELVEGPARRAALRPFAVNEPILADALASGATRLSTAPLLGPGQRAMAVPVNEAAGVGGLVFPGDRVDLFFTRPGDDDVLPNAELIAQDVRVLAVGPDMNIGKDAPEVVRAVTVAVTALQAQKLTLAIVTGQIGLALRHFSDDGRVRLQTLQAADLNDGTITRLPARPRAAAAPARPSPARPSPAPPARTQPGVTVVRGTQAQVQPVLP